MDNIVVPCFFDSHCRGHPLPFPKLHLGPCSSEGTSVGMRRGTDRHTDGHDQYTFLLSYASREM